MPAAAAPLYGGIDGILGVFAPAGNEFFEEDNPSCAWEKWRKKSDFFFIIFDFFFLFPAALYGGINGVLGAFAPAGGNWGRQNFPQWFF